MKTKNLVLAGFAIMLLSFFNTIHAQSGDNNTVKIGKQVWATTNLDISTFRNGDVIPEIEVDTLWKAACMAGKPAWCYYKNDPANGKVYGKLYNWYAVHDPRGLAPKGWHIPTGEEWRVLVYDQNSTRGEQDQNNFKSSTGWQKDPDVDDNEGNGNGNNSSGLSLFPGGYRDYDGSFYRVGTYGFFWTATEYDDINAFYCSFPNVGFQRDYSGYPKGDGISVRLVKD
jgi:uncharacterized protein (TIGR02145 family)